MAKCAECGFLAVRDIEDRRIVEAESSYRQTGKIPSRPSSSYGLYGDSPLCFARAVGLAKDIADTPPHRLRAFQQDHDCRAFTEWQQGFSPKEHAEMLLHERSEKNQQKWREAERGWRQEQAERDRQWRQEDVKLAKAGTRTALIGALIGFVGALAAVALSRLLIP